ncbi:hypothetical protein BYI23_E003180 (plasmid) [Burkholderia sp. YI23]|nr:hypothetical protein BYI23_E003180 [Burkholderia sp. YI23]
MLALLAATVTISAPLKAQAANQSPDALARAFLEAEMKSWAKTWLDNHPPGTSIKGIGGKAVFAIELLIAADRYGRASNDKERLHAIGDGAAAYVAYSYAATPAVGIIVTAVYICAQVVEGAIAGSYAEAMLQIQKRMLLTEKLRQDLVFRAGMARAQRLLILADTVERRIGDIERIDNQFRVDCSSEANDYGQLAGCMETLTRSMSLRRAIILSLEALLRNPDEELDLLAANLDDKGGVVAAEPGSERKELQSALDSMANNYKDMLEGYDKMVSQYSAIAAANLIADAENEAAPLVAREQLDGACIEQHTKIGYAAALIEIKLASAATVASNGGASKDGSPDVVAKLQSDGLSLLHQFEERRLTCPAIDNDVELAHLFDTLRADVSEPVK